MELRKAKLHCVGILRTNTIYLANLNYTPHIMQITGITFLISMIITMASNLEMNVSMWKRSITDCREGNLKIIVSERPPTYI